MTTLYDFTKDGTGDPAPVLNQIIDYIKTLESVDDVCEFIMPALSKFTSAEVRHQVRMREQKGGTEATLVNMLGRYQDKILIPGEGYVVHGEASRLQLIERAEWLRTQADALISSADLLEAEARALKQAGVYNLFQLLNIGKEVAA